MKILICFAFLIISVSSSAAQTVQPSPSRPRIVAVAPIATPTPRAVVIITNAPTPAPTSFPTPFPTPRPTPATVIVNPIPTDRPTTLPIVTALPTNFRLLSFGQLRAKIADAKRLLQTRPVTTALTDSFLITDLVRVAFFDWKTSQIDFVSLTKSVFLSKDAEISLLSANGKNVRIRIVRANGVNTPVVIFDENNQAQTPLVVQYPVEKNGSLAEMAYYTSTHPGIVTPEVINAGRLYVKNTIDIARQKLKEKGIFVSPQITDVAERLCTVEHVDHSRFWNEFQPTIYNEIFTLYALNEGNTYRYSVSRAGAGGMVQMIPSTYAMIRNRYYNVGLMPDFVEGMRNHVNAAQAMLLYMNMTWSDLMTSDTIYSALQDGTATPAELLSAGYNSNPAKLAGYIRRGGNGWRGLIPAETKIYLQIYSSLERAVPVAARTQ